jgi:hypothetical protein
MGPQRGGPWVLIGFFLLLAFGGSMIAALMGVFS